MIVTITGCALLAFWFVNHAWLTDVPSGQIPQPHRQQQQEPAAGTAIEPIPVRPRSTWHDLSLRGVISTGEDGNRAMAIIRNADQRDRVFGIGEQIFAIATLVQVHADHVVIEDSGRQEVLWLGSDTGAADPATPAPAADQTRDYTTYSLIAQALSGQPGEDSPPPPEQVLRLLDDETIEHLIETGLPDRFEQFNRLVYLQPEYHGAVITGLRVIPRGQAGVELLLGVGLLQGDLITSVNGNDFATVTEPENLPASFIVDLLSTPSTALGIRRGGSDTRITFESGKPGEE